MKRAYQSVMIKKKDMTDAENQCVLADIETYNRMKHTALVWNNQDRVFEDERSIHLHLKDRYGCNDYFANSANREANVVENFFDRRRFCYGTQSIRSQRAS